MPVLPPKGLLPGRGGAGVRPIPVLPPKGLLPGRGPVGRGLPRRGPPATEPGVGADAACEPGAAGA